MIFTQRECWRFLLAFMVVRTVSCVPDNANDISTFGEDDDYRSDGDYDLVNNEDGEDSNNAEDAENESNCVSSDEIDSYCQKNEFSVTSIHVRIQTI